MNDSNNDFEKLAFKKQSSIITMVPAWLAQTGSGSLNRSLTQKN